MYQASDFINQKKIEKNLDTPMMRQYKVTKDKYRDEILFFRMGDFYEMFMEDALYTAGVLGIALAKRSDNIPMCGIPYHALNKYVGKLLQHGKNIAICEQIEDSKDVKGRIVKRDVTRILTPGSLYEEELLHISAGGKLGIIHPDPNTSVEKYYMAAVDLATGDIFVTTKNKQELESFITLENIKELLIPHKELHNVLPTNNVSIVCKDYVLHTNKVEKLLCKIWGIMDTTTLNLNSIEKYCFYYLFSYIEEVAPMLKLSVQLPIYAYKDSHMILDDAAVRTLEIFTNQDGDLRGSLLGIMDKTNTAMGKRLLKRYLSMPFTNRKYIEKIHDAIDLLKSDNQCRYDLCAMLKNIKDIDRLVHFLNNGANISHINQLYMSLVACREIYHLFDSHRTELLELPEIIKEHWLVIPSTINDLICLMEDVLHINDLPRVVNENRFVRIGYSKNLDELFHLQDSAQKILIDFECEEKQKNSITNLKIKYSNMLGYYVEISQGQSNKVPSYYIKRQTLKNVERFSIPALSDLESKILNAKDNVITKQKCIFDELLTKILSYTSGLRDISNQISFLDVMVSHAEIAYTYEYTKPTMTHHGDLILKESRHPVVEISLEKEHFIPNDIHLNTTTRHLSILTGPNMAGKSTFMRQVGLLQIMAQIGSFIPAESATIPIVDRIFTRIGAYDRLFKGESTFFVEMLECAHIFNSYTEHSLILLDEVGRGTSTFDGVSIARAMIEYFSNNLFKAKVLFATHFTELAQLINPKKGVIGLTVKVIEENQKLIFLRKVIEGVADKSYGIHVAALAGLPEAIIQRAWALLKEAEMSHIWQAKLVPYEKSVTSSAEIINQKDNKKNQDRQDKKQLSIFESK